MMVDKRAKTTEQFIAECIEVHGDEKYSYDNTVYVSKRTKVTITCKTHGDFQIMPQNFLRGNGCSKCWIASRVKPVSEWIRDAKQVHGDFYDYSNVHYNNSHESVVIICPKHGEFEQKAYSHIQGRGCPSCGKEIKAISRRLTFDEFIEKSKKIHGELYDYSISKYKNNHTKTAIICKKHGVFHQTPNSHLSGRGCPTCAKEIGAVIGWRNYTIDSEQESIFYIIKFHSDEKNFIKIGVTKRTVNERYRQNDTNFKIDTILEIKSSERVCYDIERYIKAECLYKDISFRIHDLKESVLCGWSECYKTDNLSDIYDMILCYYEGNGNVW